MNYRNLKGVIGVVANDSKEIDLALKSNLSCVEIRADLLIHKGFSVDDVFELVKNAKQKNLFCLFTLRHQLHGGKFFGTEKERISVSGNIIPKENWLEGNDWNEENITETFDNIIDNLFVQKNSGKYPAYWVVL